LPGWFVLEESVTPSGGSAAAGEGHPEIAMSAEKKRSRKAGATDDPVIPDKLYFRIGEVAKLCKLPAYVLRFWESEFPQMKPVKSSTGQRMYRQRDVENMLRIKKLLYQEGFTIAGARQQLKAENKAERLQSGLPFPRQARSDGLKKVRQGLQEILGILKKKR
jgi:DNA-binding transcriptional MerR regulator